MNAEQGITPLPATTLLQTAETLSLECVSFDVVPGVRPSGKQPVHIFLGSEEAQQRAERIFLYTVHKFRDPARSYHVHLMKDLPGFDRRTWRTGFTCYRFAVPELAGGCGRAIYNDVNQIYLADPGELFDLDLRGHGYLTIAPGDTSVMVMDCARMLSWWNLAAARQRGKRELTREPAASPGLRAQLGAGWNARDLEYRVDSSRLLHYTTLHLQPWQPTPEQYSYRPHPLRKLWLDLQTEADADGYQPFTRTRPTAAYRRLMAQLRTTANRAPALITAGAGEFVASLGIDGQPLQCTLDTPPGEAISCFNPALSERWPDAAVPAVAVSGLLEHLPADDIPWCLDALFELAQRAIHLRIDLRLATAPCDRPAPARLCRPAAWWRDALATVAARHPGLSWQLDLIEPDGARRSFRYVPPDGPPRIWVLLARHEGDNQQLQTLAKALGWPYETRKLVFKSELTVPPVLQGASLMRVDRTRSDPLEAPWPDMVLSCSGRSAPVARWIRERSGGTALLVQLGRPRAPLKAFDLVVTTPQYRLPARANVLHNVLPLNRPQPQRTEHALAVWRARVEALPRPRIALLAGGESSFATLDEAGARRLRGQAEAVARSRAGSLLISTSPRTRKDAADALLGDSEIPGVRYRWRPNDPDNPYPAFLELADEIIVTGDSASMVADACATGHPVRYVALPGPKPGRLDVVSFLQKLAERLRGRLGERGTPRQQDAFGRWLDALVAAGVLWPSLDITLVHEGLHRGGLACALDDPNPVTPPPAHSDLDRTVAAVRRLFLNGREIPL